MAQELQEQMAPEADEQSGGSEFSSDFPTVSTPDQSDIPHHAAIDPSTETSSAES
jgi:hypothetical protein